MTPNISHLPIRAAHKASVVQFREVAPLHFQMRLHCPDLAQSAQPGQFVHVLTHPNSDSFSFDPLLRRAFSIMNVKSEGKEGDKSAIDVLFRAEGRGTMLLAQSQVGDEIDLIGPLGRPFDISSYDMSLDVNNSLFHVKQSVKEARAIVVGGGVGVPPLVFLSDVLSNAGVAVEIIVGARTSGEVIGCDDLDSFCQKVSVTTDDGSRGHHGRVIDILSDTLSQVNEETKGTLPIVYSCGPLPMLRAVAQICASFGVRCQVSMEENMPCGIGVCNGCVVRVRQKDEELGGQALSEIESKQDWSVYHSYRRVCVDGPACWADEIDWEHNNG